MSLSLCILASGSSGNAAIVRTPAGVVMIDAGIGPRSTAGRLKETGVGIGDIAAVCLTHLDSDHFNPNWIPTLVTRRVPVFCHVDRTQELIGRAANPAFADLVRPFDGSPFEPVGQIEFRPIALAHDVLGSHGFVICGADARIGYATDLGRVPAVLIERFCDVDLLCIESNYDPQMQRDSGRPLFLQRRITGGRGHLSNEQAFDAVRTILNRCQAASRRLPAHIVLLHRSRQCNCPELLRRMFSKDSRITPRLVLAEQYSPTPWLR